MKIQNYTINRIQCYNDWPRGGIKIKDGASSWEKQPNKFYYVDDLKQVQNKLDSIKPIPSTQIDDASILYVSKSSQVPRYKIKEFLQTKSTITRTRLYDRASLILYNPKYLPSILVPHKNITGSTGYLIPYDEFIPHIDFKPKWTTDFFLIYDNEKQYFPKLDFNKYKQDKIYILSNYGQQVETDNINNVLNILSNDHAQFIKDEEFQIPIQKENIILDQHQYQSLRDMLGSKDKESIRLGTEIMANSNYKESKLFILLLLNEFNNAIWRISFNTNFKSLISYLNCTTLYRNPNWRLFVSELFKTYKNDDEIQIIKEYVMRRLESEFKDIKNVSTFSIEDITLKIK